MRKFLTLLPYQIQTQQQLQNIPVQKRKMHVNEFLEMIDGGNIKVKPI